ncbi:DUF7948 domain-containing protein [Parvicella tangerina]|uniref:DUF7948 domain-containing protein n=1 Tax=Parvicella tangerina TaxID=2829795 RepID=UPI00215B81CF|nr:gliding motility-associated C-terminal domain-containing protein [Parvicella tangerina]
MIILHNIEVLDLLVKPTAKYFILCLIALLGAQLPSMAQEFHGGYQFVENKGQWPMQVTHKTDLRSGYLYLQKDGLVFDLYDAKSVNDYVDAHHNKASRNGFDSLKWHAFKVSFEGANQTLEIQTLANGKTTHFNNYYIGNDPDHWGEKAYGFGEVTYQNVYAGIDFKMYSKLFDLKYDFVVQPGADPSLISLRYEGQSKLALKKGRLHIYTEVNHVIEDEPFVYQVIDGERVLVDAEYVLEGDRLSYQINDSYDKSLPLVIDPTLIFSSYSGSFSNNFGYSATFDAQGFLYSGSSAFGNQYPTTLGAYSTSFAGGIVDIALSKFDTTGTFLIYSTYLGGNSDELPHSLIVNSLGELLVFGTTSSFNYPTTPGCYDNTFNGGTPNNLTNGLGVNYVNGSDIVVSRLSASGGNLQASTYIGGSQNDGLNSTSTTPSQNILRYNYADEVRGEVDIDVNNNIYIATCTRSPDFPVTNGVFQENYGGGPMDGIVFKMDNDLQTLIWSSFIGGEEHDAVYALALDDSSDIYVTGGTNSDSLFTTPSAIDTSFQGGRSDGFVTHISKNGGSIINSTYIGSATYDQSYFVELDFHGDVYLLGQTEAIDSSFVKNVTWSNFGSGQFVSKLSPELDTMLYSTVFGAGNGINISPTAFLVDLCSKMYLAGWGGSVNNLGTLDNNAGYTNGMPITPDAFQSTTDGSDFYVMVLEDDASGVVYGSYFGSPTASEHVDGGTSRFDRKGKVYQAICAGCGGDDNMPIVPANAVSSTNNNSCNLGVFKMDFNLPIVLADFEVDPIGCAPYTANITNTSLSQNYTTFEWIFGDGGSSTQMNPSYTFTQPGTYEITLILSDTATCNFGDTLTKEIIIMGDTTYSLSDLSICPDENVQVGILPSGDTSISYSWTPAATISNDTIANPIATPTSTTQYQLLISNGICTDTVYQTVNVDIPLLTVSNDTTLCTNNEVVTLSANSQGTSSIYVWSQNENFTDTINSNLSDNTLTVSPPATTTYYVEISNNGCTLSDSINVNVAGGDVVITGAGGMCLGDSILLVASHNTPGQSYSYDWGPDSVIVGDGNDSIYVTASQSQQITLLAANAIGCVVTDTVFVTVDPLPTLNMTLTASADTIYAGTEVVFTANPQGYGYTWNFGAGNSNEQTLTFEESETVIATAISPYGCAKSDTVFIYVKELICGEPDIFIPNAFTPNADNTNDNLYVRGNNIDEFVLRIYDRWGELVFETTDQSVGWDGTFKGKECDPAVYDYYLEATCIDQEQFFKKGNITLIR